MYIWIIRLNERSQKFEGTMVLLKEELIINVNKYHLNIQQMEKIVLVLLNVQDSYQMVNVIQIMIVLNVNHLKVQSDKNVKIRMLQCNCIIHNKQIKLVACNELIADLIIILILSYQYQNYSNKNNGTYKYVHLRQNYFNFQKLNVNSTNSEINYLFNAQIKSDRNLKFNKQNLVNMFTQCEHQFQEIIGFCLSKECHGNSSYCLDCIQRDTHDSHIVDLKSIDEIILMLMEHQTTLEQLQTKIRDCRLNNFNEINGKWNYYINKKLKDVENKKTDKFLTLINKIKESINQLIQLVLQEDKRKIANQISKIWPYHKNYQQKKINFYSTYYEQYELLNIRNHQCIQLQAQYIQKLQRFILAFSEQIQKDPEQNFDSYFKRIETLKKLGEYDFANESLEKIVSLAPNDLKLNEKVGDSLMINISEIENMNGFNNENLLKYENELYVYQFKIMGNSFTHQQASLHKCQLIEMKIGYGLVFAGRIEEAIKRSEKLLLKSNNEKDCLGLFDYLLSLRQYSQTTQQLKKYLKKFPQNDEAKQKLHILLEIENTSTKAINYFNKVIEIQPNYLIAYQKIAQLLELKQSYDEAFQCYQKIIQLEPSNELGYLLKGDSLEKYQFFEGAIQCFDELIKLQPNSENGYLKKCHILGNSNHIQFKETYQISNRIQVQETNEFQILEEEEFQYRGMSCSIQPFNKPYYRILQCYDQFIKGCPHNKIGYIKKLKLLERLRRSPEALNFFQKNSGIEIKQKLLEVINNYENAVECCKQLIKICPQEQYGYLQMGEILKLYELNEEGVNFFEEMIKLHPKNKLGYFYEGYFLEKLNRFDEACQCYEELISTQPAIEEGYWYQGQLLEKLNRPKEAIECIDRFIQIQPQNDFGPRYKNQILEQMKKNKQAI